jgi:hypothetical protein
MLKEYSKAPIHIEEITSSTPSHLDKPSPAPTAKTQSGHTAEAEPAKNIPENKNEKYIKNLLRIIIVLFYL